ncbi:MAG TPA: hypothetical protein VHU80_21780 [Polyangiaceae bacterium]|jgi:hypothetical protein|nr:hypothetical protein [Polyangiaceae bacterium]
MSDRDPTDTVAKTLFAAARRERPSEESRARTLAAMHGDPRASGEGAKLLHPGAPVAPREPRFRRRVWYVALAAAAMLAAAFVVRMRSPMDVSISPETHPMATAEAKSTASAPAEPTPSLTDESSRPREPLPPARRAAPSVVKRHEQTKVPEAPPPASLSDEVAALDRARSALDANDATRALELLDAYDRSGSRLTAEATMLRVEALSRSGRREQAAELARQFTDSNPDSPLVERARTFFAGDSAERGSNLGGHAGR